MSILFKNVFFRYETGHLALDDVTFGIDQGEFVLIIGHNGAGKSTMLRLLNGILRPTRGSIFLMDKETNTKKTFDLAKLVSVTFQNPADQIFASTVYKEIEYGPVNLQKTNVFNLTEKALSMYALKEVSNEHPYDLTETTRKLITLASACAMDTPILAFDEPTAGLSFKEKNIVLSAFLKLMGKRRTLLVVSHDLESFLPLCSRVLVFHKGILQFDGSRVEFQNDLGLLRKYGIRLPLSLRLRPHVGLHLYSKERINER